MEHLIDELYVVKDGKAVLRDKKEVKADKKLYILHIATHGAYRVQKGNNVEQHPCFC